MKLYQLVIRGHLRTGTGKHRFHSARVFRSHDAAEAYIPEFQKICLEDRHSIVDIYEIEETKVIELELRD